MFYINNETFHYKISLCRKEGGRLWTIKNNVLYWNTKLDINLKY